MQENKGITIVDAFKALDDISDDVVKEEVKKVSRKKRIKESLKEDKKVIKLDISGDNMYDKGQAYYYARTGDHVDYSGKKYEIAQDDTHKIGYSDTILLKVAPLIKSFLETSIVLSSSPLRRIVSL